ncbi:SMC-Scp complex subunit ScpB [Paenibacillus thiaminolyticus]|uniref:Segregation and condensation protein B n=1 Tax=Paenibacillus thiaminolyticus TaxID=49283 RepID=A0AAP9DV01_PANTH|nr:SMC-Scp complex subunit ScpB [Paenibacillus thiaminolyticus]MCY9538566.1 SMC-Scp complex subunit ScpB [Paenibacillus thiaminolyticus]MCY9604459.1 SMC-Scp complex subunit ScpB [Paenibacillus thiaminolyticus]MCY9609719.1 SMC-Scp complex subunit ScpB [Paenibacillus thiaminolyticus]MCY9616197.1 SMC-Scp complex subunit ScpB [Paenibacillus thiaminolyticus]MCY9617973.1 SMC-Scp complex subunit ScpB [Paenibacillus thiaminolyticus]
MDFQTLKSIIEGLLFMAGDEGLNSKQIAEITKQRQEIVMEALHDLQADMERSKRGIQIVAIAGMYQLTTLPDHAPYFERMAYSPSRSSLSQAALETLAIVAYRQPITRVEIEEVRGVKSDRAIQTLVNKDLIEETGRAEAIGRPILYGTTRAFLDYFGLASLSELPEASAFEQNEGLEEETQLLFQKLEGRQLTIEDVNEEGGER